MENVISYETFRKFQRIEHENDSLQPIPEDFYRSCADWMKRKEKLYEETKELSIIREIDNVMQIMKDIMDRREKKILLLASHSTRSNLVPKNLLKDEVECFGSMSSTLKNFREKMLKSLSGGEPVPVDDSQSSVPPTPINIKSKEG